MGFPFLFAGPNANRCPWRWAVAVLGVAASLAHGQTLPTTVPAPDDDLPAVQAAEKTIKVEPTLRAGLAWQLALEHAGFSPGVLDGKTGRKTAYATSEFQKAHDLPASGALDDATKAALTLPGDDVVRSYRITSADHDAVTGTFKDWNAKGAAEKLGYETLADCIAERFHCTQGCIGRLNPGVSLTSLSVGDTLIVPDVGDDITPLLTRGSSSGDWTLAGPRKSYPRCDRLEVNLAQKTIRLFNSSGKVIALFHCSIAADKAKRPSGDAQVIVVALPPNYTFNPSMWPDVHNVDHVLTIPPGPRNPVGLAWTGLSLPGYGMHGTPKPDQIGKTGSHGCFRLANWDAIHLARMMRVGLPITFVGNATNE